MTRCICSTAYLRLSSCGDVQYASLASCLSFPFPYPVFLIVRHLLSASLHPAAASPCRASPVTWRWAMCMSSYILHSRATLPSTSRICRRSYIKMAIILPMTATKMIYPKMILCCNGIRFFSIRITSYSKCNFLPRQTLQARPATKLNNIFLFFFSQQKEEHTTLPPFFIRILS